MRWLCLAVLGFSLAISSTANASAGWAFLRHVGGSLGPTPIGSVWLVDRGHVSGEEWNLIGFAARDHFLGRTEVCTFVVIGAARTSAAAGGSCGLTPGARSRYPIEFLSDGYGIFGAVPDRVARLNAISAGHSVVLKLISGPRTLRTTARFFAIPSPELPDYLVARDASGNVLARIPV